MAKTKRTFRKINKRNKRKSTKRVSKRHTRKMKGGIEFDTSKETAKSYDITKQLMYPKTIMAKKDLIERIENEDVSGKYIEFIQKYKNAIIESLNTNYPNDLVEVEFGSLNQIILAKLKVEFYANQTS
jgi:hypothetical protein